MQNRRLLCQTPFEVESVRDGASLGAEKVERKKE